MPPSSRTEPVAEEHEASLNKEPSAFSPLPSDILPGFASLIQARLQSDFYRCPMISEVQHALTTQRQAYAF
jgi:hypothetical protein